MAKKISQITLEESTSVSDTDLFEGEESGGTSFKIAFSIIKSTLKTYFDALYQAVLTASNFGDFIVALTGKTTPVDTDTLTLSDSAANDDAKKVTWANVKATLKTYFDTLYTGSTLSTTIGGCSLIWNSGSSLSVSTGLCYAENGDEINITSTLTASSLTPSASTWYHVYVYLSGGSPAMEVVTTAPAAWKGTARSKTGDTSRRYIGSVKSDASGTPVFYNFEHNPQTNQITYRLISQAATPFRVLSSGTSTTAASVSLAGVVPVTGRSAYLRMFSSSDAPAHFGTATLTTTAYQMVLNVGSTVNQANYGIITMDASQVIYYMTSGRTAGVIHIDTNGYFYDR